jgi:hypothetical protein
VEVMRRRIGIVQLLSYELPVRLCFLGTNVDSALRVTQTIHRIFIETRKITTIQSDSAEGGFTLFESTSVPSLSNTCVVCCIF